MKPRRLVSASLSGAILLAWCVPAAAVIKVEMPVSKMFETSRAVLVGEVTGVTAANRVVDVKVIATLKGKQIGERFRVQIATPAKLIEQVSPGRPVALMVGKAKGGSVAVVHVADTWLLAKLLPGSKPQAWRTVGVHDAGQAFPGRTVALVRILKDIKAGRTRLLDKVEQKFFRGGVREVVKLDVVKPRSLAAADVDGDKKPDLLIGAARGVRLFLAAGAGFKDATAKWGLAGSTGAFRASGDTNGDGRADLWVGETLWLNDGRRFAPGARLKLPDKAKPLGAALTDVTGDGKPDAVVLLTGGQLITFKNPGAAGKAWPRQPGKALWKAGRAAVAAAFGDWGDSGRPHVMVVRPDGPARYALGADGGPPADYRRLTGTRLGAHHKAHRDGLKNVRATAINVNGDKRPDLFIVATGGGLLLVNRGFGAFLVDPEAGGAVMPHGRRPLPFKLTPTTLWTAADMYADGWDDLLVLTDDGRLYEVDNPPPARPPPAGPAGNALKTR